MDFFTTHISNNAFIKVKEVLESKHISAGKVADEFEKELINRLGIINPVSVNSGTSALHLALACAGVLPGDEVILPAQTFISTGLVILMQGAIPVFADIQVETGNIDPISVKLKITEKTKAIIVVHWGGYPCDMDEIKAIAMENNLIVIEDAAHALGATYKGKPIGAISEFTCFSFQAIKHLTTGDGGALCCLNTIDYINAKRRRWFDIDRDNTFTSILGEREYDAFEIGYKYHLNDYSAALGIANLEDISIILDKRTDIAKRYTKELAEVAGLKLLNYNSDRHSAWWLFTMLVEQREDFIRKLAKHGIPSSVVHLRIDSNTVLGGLRKDLINQEKFNNMQVSIPIHSDLQEADINHIISTIKNGW